MANFSFSKQKPHKHGQPNQHFSSGLGDLHPSYMHCKPIVCIRIQSIFELFSLMIALSGQFFLLSVFVS